VIILIISMIVIALFVHGRAAQPVDAVYMTQAEQTPAGRPDHRKHPRGDFRVTPAVASRRLSTWSIWISKRGWCWSSEGNNPSRVRQLMGQEKRRLAKVIGSAKCAHRSSATAKMRCRSASSG